MRLNAQWEGTAPLHEVILAIYQKCYSLGDEGLFQNPRYTYTVCVSVFALCRTIKLNPFKDRELINYCNHFFFSGSSVHLSILCEKIHK